MDCIFDFKLSSTQIIYYSRMSIFEQKIIDLQHSLCVLFRITQRLQARLRARDWHGRHDDRREISTRARWQGLLTSRECAQ